MNYSVMNYIDGILNRVTMYRLVLYYLLGLLGVAFVFGFFKVVPYDPTALAFSLVVILLVCAATNYVFAWVFKAASNVESIYITALILALIIEPVTAADHAGVGFLIFASVWASASKFIFAISKKHVFNPAAFAVVLTAFVIAQPATWWVGGSMPMMPFVLVGGLLLVRKIKRFDLVGSFVVVGVISTVVTARVGTDYVQLIIQTLTHSPMLFLGFVMLTEPLTTPPSAPQRVVYGAIVGFFASPFIHFGGFYFTPELALLVGNVFSFVVSPQGRHVLVLTAIEKKANDVFDFVFSFDRPFSFRPGQYMEWTLGHKFPDNRGNRRYFTIASAPTEPEVRLGVKF